MGFEPFEMSIMKKLDSVCKDIQLAEGTIVVCFEVRGAPCAFMFGDPLKAVGLAEVVKDYVMKRGIRMGAGSGPKQSDGREEDKAADLGDGGTPRG